MEERPRGAEMIFEGDFNVDLEGMDGRGREKEIAAEIAMEGIEDIAGKFLPKRQARSKDQRTWEMVR